MFLKLESGMQKANIFKKVGLDKWKSFLEASWKLQKHFRLKSKKNQDSVIFSKLELWIFGMHFR